MDLLLLFSAENKGVIDIRIRGIRNNFFIEFYFFEIIFSKVIIFKT
tara:strand:- start:291 stop:428 length:138 start_codon:yes stop_codon:yes gene_type:complete